MIRRYDTEIFTHDTIRIAYHTILTTMIELEFGLDIEFELGLTNESSQAKLKLKLLYFISSSSLNIICRLVSSQVKLKYFTFAVEPSLNIHYSTKLNSFTALVSTILYYPLCWLSRF